MYSLLTHLLGFLLVIFLTETCSASSEETHSSHEIGGAIDGEYSVSFGGDFLLIGHLNLQNGEYEFSPQPGVDEQLSDACSRFFFVQHRQGTYCVEYYGSISFSSVLESLENHEILLTILFDTSAVENHVPDPVLEPDRAFLLRSDLDGSILYFHSTVSEYELWSVEKGSFSD